MTALFLVRFVSSLTDRTMFRFGLFQACNNGLNFQPVAVSTVNPEHLMQFEFAGKTIALLVYYKSTTGMTSIWEFFEYSRSPIYIVFTQKYVSTIHSLLLIF